MVANFLVLFPASGFEICFYFSFFLLFVYLLVCFIEVTLVYSMYVSGVQHYNLTSVYVLQY